MNLHLIDSFEAHSQSDNYYATWILEDYLDYRQPLLLVAVVTLEIKYHSRMTTTSGSRPSSTATWAGSKAIIMGIGCRLVVFGSAFQLQHPIHMSSFSEREWARGRSSPIEPCTNMGVDNTCSMSTRLNLFNKLNDPEVLQNLDSFLFGNLFEQDKNKEKVDPHKEFVHLTRLASRSFSVSVDGSEDNDPNENNIDVAQSSLSSYVLQWAKLLRDEGAITTPVSISSFVKDVPAFTPHTAVTIDDQQKHPVLPSSSISPVVVKSTAIKIMFVPPKRYLSYKEQRGLEKGVVPDRKGGKLDAGSPGGIEIIVQTVAILDAGNIDNVLQVPVRGLFELELLARRCDIDGDTIVKVTSERAIVRRLKEAIRIWTLVRKDMDEMKKKKGQLNSQWS